jgi:hypothetical protein
VHDPLALDLQVATGRGSERKRGVSQRTLSGSLSGEATESKQERRVREVGEMADSGSLGRRLNGRNKKGPGQSWPWMNDPIAKKNLAGQAPLIYRIAICEMKKCRIPFFHYWVIAASFL